MREGLKKPEYYIRKIPLSIGYHNVYFLIQCKQREENQCRCSNMKEETLEQRDVRTISLQFIIVLGPNVKMRDEPVEDQLEKNQPTLVIQGARHSVAKTEDETEKSQTP